MAHEKIQQVQDGETTARADVQYEQYVNQERERRIEQRAQEVQQDIREDLQEIDNEVEQYKQEKIKDMKRETVNPSLTPYFEGIVQSVDYKENASQLEIEVELSHGERFTDRLDVGIPEEPSEFETLCEYVGVPPKPSALRGEVIPVVTDEMDELELYSLPVLVFNGGGTSEICRCEDNTIDTPSMMDGLHPLVHKTRRVCQKFVQSSGDYRRTFIQGVAFLSPVWISLIAVAISYALMFLSFAVSFDPISVPLTAISIIAFSLSATYAVFVGISIISYSLSAVVLGLALILANTWTYLFPQK